MPFRVLLADENLAVQKLVELTLHREGMEVISADNGLSALDLALKWPPDIILADFNLEGLSFRQFHQKVKQKESLKEIPVIVLVNSTEIYDAGELKSQGVYLILKKPIDAEQLASEVGRMMAPPEKREEDPEAQEASSLPEHFSETEESLKIEELLGWASPEGERNESEKDLGAEENIIPDLPGEESEEMFTLEELPEEIPLDGSQNTDVATVSEDEEEIESVVAAPSFTDKPIEPSEDLEAHHAESRNEEEEPPEGFSASKFTETGETETGFSQVDEVDDLAAEETLVSASFFDSLPEEPEIQKESTPPSSLLEEDTGRMEGIQIPEQDSEFEAETEMGIETEEADESPKSFIFEADAPENSEIAAEEKISPVDHDIQQDFDSSQPLEESPLDEISDEKTTEPESPDVEATSAPSFPLEVEKEKEPLEQAMLDEAVKQSVRESVERITWEVLPDLIRSTLSKETMNATIEKVVWEVIPSLAEVEIKKEIKRLQGEVEED
ncbi:MAG: response regulator [Nitrospiria bacterium]